MHASFNFDAILICFIFIEHFTHQKSINTITEHLLPSSSSTLNTSSQERHAKAWIPIKNFKYCNWNTKLFYYHIAYHMDCPLFVQRIGVWLVFGRLLSGKTYIGCGISSSFSHDYLICPAWQRFIIIVVVMEIMRFNAS